jgi:hypothetical protein
MCPGPPTTRISAKPALFASCFREECGLEAQWPFGAQLPKGPHSQTRVASPGAPGLAAHPPHGHVPPKLAAHHPAAQTLPRSYPSVKAKMAKRGRRDVGLERRGWQTT